MRDADSIWESMKLKEFDTLMEQLQACRRRYYEAVEEYDRIYGLAVALMRLVKAAKEHSALTTIEQMQLSRAHEILSDWLENEKESEK